MFATAIGARINPACAIDEYARSLTGFVCCKADKLPTNIVIPEMNTSIIPNPSPDSKNIFDIKIINATKPVALELTDR